MLTANRPEDPDSRERREADGAVHSASGSAGGTPIRILVVDHTLREAYAAVTPLASAGFSVTVSRTFDAAKALLEAGEYGLLIAALRLGMHNGLHLVVRARSMTTWIPALVTAHAEDPVLRADAERLGATYVVLPAPNREFLAAVVRTCLRGPLDGGPLRPPFERRAADRRVAAPDDGSLERRLKERRALLIRHAMEGTSARHARRD